MTDHTYDKHLQLVSCGTCLWFSHVTNKYYYSNENGELSDSYLTIEEAKSELQRYADFLNR